MKELRSLRQGANPVDFEAINELITISTEYEQVKTGPPVSLATLNAGMPNRRYPKLKAEMILLLLPQHLGAPERKPAPGETVDAYLNRLTRETKEAGEWALLVRVLETASLLAGRHMSHPPELAALNHSSGERINMSDLPTAQAVLSYQSALREGGRRCRSR